MKKHLFFIFITTCYFTPIFTQKAVENTAKSAKKDALKSVALISVSSDSLTKPLNLSSSSRLPASAQKGLPMQWISLAEADRRMHDSLNKRKMYVFFYADWCTFCHAMEAKTFENQELVDYLNANFWCVKFNTELTDTVRFGGKLYGAARQNGWDCNGFAKEYLGEKLAFPSNLLLDEHGSKMAALGGYQTYFQLMTFVTYFHENFYKTVDLETYGTNYKMPSWNGKGGRSGTVRRLPTLPEDVKKVGDTKKKE